MEETLKSPNKLPNRGAYATEPEPYSASALFAIAWVALSLSACDDKSASAPASQTKPDPSAAAPATAMPTPTTMTPPVATPMKLAERLKCAALLPERALTGPLSNMKVTQSQAHCPECGPVCSLVLATKPYEGVGITYICNEKYSKEAQTKKLAELKPVLKKSKVLTDIGRGGIAGDKESGLFYEVVAYDDDSDCVVTVDWMHGKPEGAMLVAKAAIAGVKAADLLLK
jgi:hypothetical protein